MMYRGIAMNMAAGLHSVQSIVLPSVALIWSTGPSLDIFVFCIFWIIQNQEAFKAFINSYINPATVTSVTVAAAISLTIFQFFKYFLNLRSGSDSSDEFPVKSMLFPCRTSHTRLFPEKHSFSYSYLLVGITVGWKGSIGGMLSADNEPDSTPWYLRLFSLKPGNAWYTVNGDDYLGRGHVDGGLEGKLHAYLLSQVPF
jgi:hypothetical protein